jgi:hypothetical protein
VLAPGTSRDLIPTLDAEPGLRRLSSSEGEVLWRVAGVTSRARLVADDKQTPLGIAPGGTTSSDPYLEQPMPEGGGTRTLVAGTVSDAGWRAVLVDGSEASTALTPSPGPSLLAWSQGFEVPEGEPTVRVSFDGAARTRWLWLEAFVLLALVVLALPARRREDPDPDIDDDLVLGPRTDPRPAEPALALSGGEA